MSLCGSCPESYNSIVCSSLCMSGPSGDGSLRDVSSPGSTTSPGFSSGHESSLPSTTTVFSDSMVIDALSIAGMFKAQATLLRNVGEAEMLEMAVKIKQLETQQIKHHPSPGSSSVSWPPISFSEAKGQSYKFAATHTPEEEDPQRCSLHVFRHLAVFGRGTNLLFFLIAWCLSTVRGCKQRRPHSPGQKPIFSGEATNHWSTTVSLPECPHDGKLVSLIWLVVRGTRNFCGQRAWTSLCSCADDVPFNLKLPQARRCGLRPRRLQDSYSSTLLCTTRYFSVLPESPVVPGFHYKGLRFASPPRFRCI